MRALYDIDAAILACVDQETGEILDPEKINHVLSKTNFTLANEF